MSDTIKGNDWEIRPGRWQDSAPDVVDVDDLRTRFEGAMRNAFHESGHLDGLTSPERGAFYHNVNSTLKNVIMCGRSRKNWGVDHYEAAAGWLRQRYGIDLSWIFKVAQTAA